METHPTPFNPSTSDQQPATPSPTTWSSADTEVLTLQLAQLIWRRGGEGRGGEKGGGKRRQVHSVNHAKQCCRQRAVSGQGPRGGHNTSSSERARDK